MPSNFKLLFFFCSQRCKWCSLCLFHLLQFLILAFLSVTVSSAHPSSGSCSFSGVNHYCFLVAVTFCIYHVLASLSTGFIWKRIRIQERPFLLSRFWHHVSFFIWLESFFSLSLGNNFSLCFWEVSLWNCPLLYVATMALGVVSYISLLHVHSVSSCGISSAFRNFC